MRFIFFLLLILFINCTAVSQSLSGYITKLENEITYAKNNSADPGKIKELEKILEEMKFTQSYLDKGVMPKPKPNTNISPGSSWSGFLSSIRVGSTEVPVSTRNSQIYLFFSEAVPTLHRNFNENEELNFTDDKGTGTLKDHAVITIGNQTSTCDCSGSGAAELHEVVVNLFDSTYTIDAIAPVCTGASGPDGSCGLTFSIAISSEKLTNPNILSGSRTVTTETGGIKATVTNTWYLVRTKDVELIVKPHDYDTWLPEPGTNEKTVGKKPMTVDLVLQGMNGKPLKQKAKSFEIRLEKTSKEPGITINYPLQPLSPSPPDLQLMPQANANIENESQNMKINCGGCTTASFKIGAFDGGAYSTLTAVAILEDESRITGHLFVPTGTTEITIPKRNGSMIAETWLKKNGNPGDFDDKDSSSGNNHNGDGLTAYEEYRGVISEGIFKRLDPQKKELGVWMKKMEFVSFFKEGIEMFEVASDISVIRFFDSEMATDRKLNRNFFTAHIYDQYVLKLVNGPCTTNAIGQNEPLLVHDKIPKMSERAVVDIMQIKKYHSYAKARGITFPYTESEEIASTTAHELGHGVHINHHGYMTPRLNIKIIYPQPKVTIVNVRGDTIKWRPYTLTGLSGTRENDASGDCDCFMTYNNVYNWAMTGPPGKVLCKGVPDIAVGKLLCSKQDGTNINATPYYFGNATGNFGNCIKKLKLKP